MSGFAEATAVSKVAEGRYTAELDGGYRIGEALNGGYLMAVLLRAAVDASPHAHPVATNTAFLRVGRPGPAEISVQTRKTGRTAATAWVTLSQGDVPIVDAQVTTGTLDPDAEPSWAGQAPPALPPLEECVGGAPSLAKDRGFADRVDMRFDPATMGWLDGQPSGRLEMSGHFRLRDDDYAPDAYLLALAVDALPPVVLNTGSPGWAPTVELTWHMRAVPAPGALTLYGGGRMVRDGWFDEEVEVWDSAGRLVAQSRQLARVGRQTT
ncbi:Acyl-CoA thioesterase [Thermomonospora echinospora]|uniref:Acyl-CoA thioesterase n=1 Tax=Thermomonospora echinospora TaxID=1992 RepID=A0A1H5VS91_9ACTN|nr:thioesterase family protein [Thermomonospora echinospora]SEF90100.1 Acyl-CoA thioesterase [Thermomonospora echinospora]